MIFRFCLYSIFKNLRFFEAFFLVYLLVDREVGGLGLSLFQVGSVVGFQKLLTALCEVPAGVLTDRWGRRRALLFCFGAYVVAFPGYALSAIFVDRWSLGILVFSHAVFALGEAMRTGSHKAIMLDWLEQTGRSERATEVIARTRFFSKAASASAALGGGLILYLTGSFAWLFWCATVSAVGGVILMASYPRFLEGEQARAAALGRRRPTWGAAFRSLRSDRALVFLLAGSVIFEVHAKLGAHYIQPVLEQGLRIRDISIAAGAGALVVGFYYFIGYAVGAVSAFASSAALRWVGSRSRSLLLAVVLSVVLFLGLGVGLRENLSAFVLLPALFAISALQNLRRPIFVASLDTVMDPRQRATILSTESLLRNLGIAILAPLTGLIADRYGLDGAFRLMAVTLAMSLLFRFGTDPFDRSKSRRNSKTKSGIHHSEITDSTRE